MTLSRASDEPLFIIKAAVQAPDGSNNIMVYLNPLEYASTMIQLLISGLDNKNVISRFSIYGDASRMASPLHAIIYLLDKVIQDIHGRFSYHVETMIGMIADVKDTMQKQEDALTLPLRVRQRDVGRGERALAAKLKDFNEFPKKKQLRTGQQKYLADLMAQKDEFAEQRKDIRKERDQLELEISKNLSATDFIDALRDDFWDACIMAIEQEMLEFVSDAKSASTTYTLYQEFQRLQDMFCSVFGYHSRDLKGATLNYLASRIHDLETRGKCEVLRPFGHKFLRMLTGKQPAKTYTTPSAVDLVKLQSGAKRTDLEMALSQLRAIHDLVKVFTTPLMEDGIERQISALVRNLITRQSTIIDAVQPMVAEKIISDDLRTRLQALAGVGYDLRYVIRFINGLMHQGYRNGIGGNPKDIKMIKTWIICQIMRRIQYFASSCVDHDHGQIEMIIAKYSEFSGEKLPWESLFRSLSIFGEHISYQIASAAQICKMLKTLAAVKDAGLLKNPTREADKFSVSLYEKLGFGGLPSMPGLMARELQRRKMGRVVAEKKFEEYLSNYDYIWNLNDFSENFGGIFTIAPFVNPKEEYNKYLSQGTRTGTWSVNHGDRLCELRYQLKYNLGIANLLSKFAPKPLAGKKRY
jgi:hypothetical protein